MRIFSIKPRPLPDRVAGSRYAACCACLLLACVGAGSAHTARAPAKRLNVQVLRDRLTLSVTRHPQVYLYGVIDAGAPQRVEALIASGRISPGSDIYLNARTGDIQAGMALGRLFRRGGMATHLGAPRQPRHASAEAKTAVCVDACAYAYFGGLYRWPPSGMDRIGLTMLPGPGSRDAPVMAYLKDMGIDLDALEPAFASSRYRPVWLGADQMKAAALANNGQLPPTVTVHLDGPAPTLQLQQTDRRGSHRLTIQCRPGKTTVTAYDEVGALRARQVAARSASSYFQLNDRRVLSQPRDGATAAGDALVIRRDYPPADLVDLVSAWSFGAWVDGRSSAFRDGFSLPLHPVFDQLKAYFYACWRAAPWPPRQRR